MKGRRAPANAQARSKLPFFSIGNEAKGFIAVGNVARGVFAFGNVAIGSVFAMGNVAVGLVAVGNVAVSPIVAVAATIAAGGIVGRAGVFGFGAASTRWLGTLGIHIGTTIDIPLPLGLLAAPIVWLLVAKRLAPERSILRTQPRVGHIERRGSSDRHRFSGRLLEVRKEAAGSIYVVDAGAEAPFEISGPPDRAKRGDDVLIDATTERIESPKGGDYRSAATLTERLVSTAVRVVPPTGEPDDSHVLAVWYSRAFVIALLAIPLSLVLITLR